VALVNTKADEVAKAHGTPYTFQQLHMLRQIVRTARTADPQADKSLIQSAPGAMSGHVQDGQGIMSCSACKTTSFLLCLTCSVQSKAQWVSSVRYCVVGALCSPCPEPRPDHALQATHEDVDGRSRTGSTTWLVLC